jgi:hypothetical protein
MTPANKILFSARVNYSLNHQGDEEMSERPEDEDLGIQGLNYLKKMEREAR